MTMGLFDDIKHWEKLIKLHKMQLKCFEEIEVSDKYPEQKQQIEKFIEEIKSEIIFLEASCEKSKKRLKELI